MNKKLSSRQAAFCREVARGESLSSAYRNTHNVKQSTTANSVNTLASRLASKVEVRSRIEELQAKRDRAVVNSAVTDRDQVLKHLRLWITGELEASQSQLRSAELLGKTVSGLFSDKVEVVTDNRSADDIALELERKLSLLSDDVNKSTTLTEDNGSVH